MRRLDLESVVLDAADDHVRAIVGDGTDLSQPEDGSFDDFTPVGILTDQSFTDDLTPNGWQVEHVSARCLPLSMRSRGSSVSFLVPWDLRPPGKPLAGQMLVVARRPREPAG